MMTECEKFISVVDNDILRPSDAIILLEGDGLNRYQKAVELYKQNIAAKIVLVAILLIMPMEVFLFQISYLMF